MCIGSLFVFLLSRYWIWAFHSGEMALQLDHWSSMVPSPEEERCLLAIWHNDCLWKRGDIFGVCHDINSSGGEFSARDAFILERAGEACCSRQGLREIMQRCATIELDISSGSIYIYMLIYLSCGKERRDREKRDDGKEITGVLRNRTCGIHVLLLGGIPTAGWDVAQTLTKNVWIQLAIVVLGVSVGVLLSFVAVVWQRIQVGLVEKTSDAVIFQVSRWWTGSGSS
jgi:hypothetical protein